MKPLGLARKQRNGPPDTVQPPYTKALLGLALALAVATPALAETLDFSHCVDLALKQNPGLAATKSQITQAEAAVNQADGTRMPKVTLSLNGVRTNDALSAFGLKLGQRNTTFGDFGFSDFLTNTTNPNLLAIAPNDLNHPNAVTNFNTRIEAQLPLYTGGMIEGYVLQAQSSVQAAQDGDQAARQQVIFHVLQAYDGTHAARAYVEVAKQGEIAAQADVKMIENLVKQGVVVKSDLLSAQIFLENTRIQLKQAQNGAESALEQLHLLLGMPLSEPLDIGPRIEPSLLPGQVADLREQALANHPRIKAMRAQLAAAEGNIQVAKSGRYPQVGVTLRQDWNDKSLGLASSSYTVGAQMSWNVFDAGVTNAAVNRATSAKLELASRLQETESSVAYQVGDAMRKADEAQHRLAVHDLSVAQAQEALNLVEKRYQNGVTTLVELLAARTQLDKAKADRVTAQYDLAVQRASVRLAVGNLDPDLK
ncbi:TolC family protein [Rhodoferax sp.]|uniref:TolC family protein n=1 Tax=Rhodoferax sp. TaxID=50421 RepID=UPI00284D6027|nr:TolC family protein [Rhodoferax sp.]MDR3368459.1 TolC family protein [Rhodoferax sp.]